MSFLDWRAQLAAADGDEDRAHATPDTRAYPTGVSAPGLRDVSETMLGMTTALVRGYSCGPKISSTNSAVGRSDNAWIRT